MRPFLQLGFCVILILAAGMPFTGAEIRKATVTERKVAALPEATELAGPLPRPVLMVKLEERGEHVSDRTDSSYWVFDPAMPEKGLYRIFSGPGNNHYVYFETPLIGGWGVMSGRLDPAKEPDEASPWFWFNLLSGEIGPTIDVNLWRHRMEDGWLVGQQQVEGKEGSSLDRIARYHPLKAVAQTTELDFSYINWLDRTDVLGVAKLDVGERVIRLDVETSDYEIIADPPPGHEGHAERWGGYFISPAGKDGRDGIYAVDGFSLWFRPTVGAWNQVIRDVHIVKTFGGMPPSLPARYVGNGRFAVAKTVQDEIAVPKSTPRDEVGFGAAVAVTMLIDGVTGETLKESAPHIYNHNPTTEIPDNWWAAGLKPKPPEPEPERKSLFQWDEENRELRLADGKVMKLGEDDEHEESDDGRHLVIYQQCPRGGGKEQTKIPFRIIDGATGQIHTAEVASDFFEVWVDVSWQLLSSQNPDPQMLKNYQEAGPGPN